MAANDYTTQALIDRVTLKAFTSTSSSLTPQQLVDLANDSLRSYLVPIASTLREEWWIGKADIVLTADSDGAVTLPDSVASSLRTVAWNNGGIITPLSRIEPENSFQYLAMQGQLPLGFELRGFTLFTMPKVPGAVLHLTAMLRPPQMVLDDTAAEVASSSPSNIVVEVVPLAWQETTPDEFDIISGTSPFSVLGTVGVSSVIGTSYTVTGLTSALSAALTAALLTPGGAWVSDVGTSPFANIPIELYPLLEQDIICTVGQMTGDKRLDGWMKRKTELEGLAKRTMAPRASGNARVITNPSAPGMRSSWFWPRR